jgi:hypothetical protein
MKKEIYFKTRALLSQRSFELCFEEQENLRFSKLNKLSNLIL